MNIFLTIKCHNQISWHNLITKIFTKRQKKVKLTISGRRGWVGLTLGLVLRRLPASASLSLILLLQQV